MKKVLSILGLFAGLALNPAQAADSTITISGNVVDNTCQVSLASQDFIVNLHSYSTKLFFKTGSYTEMVPFRLQFDACGSAAVGVRIGFNGVTITNDNSLLRNDSASLAASGIGIQILSADQEVLFVNQEQDDLRWTRVSSGAASSVLFYARMVANVTPVTAGLVKATATMTLEFQ